MPKSSLAGHPLHPMLVVAPAALIPFAFILDALHRSTDNDDYANAAYYSLTGGLVGGIAAGVAGAMDYLTIDQDTEVKRTANVHAILNGAALAATAANVLMRKDNRRHTGGSFALSALAAAGVIVSGWFGGRMVYELGMRVEGVDPTAGKPALGAPGDERIDHSFMDVEKYAAAANPAPH
ncbi:DUF2231 domain-containing protein [Massilia niastensis]|uniref:DUF2231 domain-containing protein n=1 Tax=Massilia niastensis TaxID=544911 RepID=UPI00035CCE92|nr:DUF2231 domain-containing protein [Massilia niastensis]